MTRKRNTKFSSIIGVDQPLPQGMGMREAERDEGEQILWNWVKVARWHFSDEEVADLLEKEGAKLREASQ